MAMSTLKTTSRSSAVVNGMQRAGLEHPTVFHPTDHSSVSSSSAAESSKYALQQYHGYAFESFSTTTTPPTDKPVHDPRYPDGWSGDVNTNVQWCVVVKSGIKNVRLIMGGEVDCVGGE
jgi:RAT1-interacting protein